MSIEVTVYQNCFPKTKTERGCSSSGHTRSQGLNCFILDICVEVLDAWKKVENAVVSMASVGLSVNSEASKEAEGYVATSETLICELFPAIMETLQNEDEDVRAAPLPFLLAYANKLKSTKKRRGVLPEVNKSYYNSLVHLSLGRQDKC